MPDPIVSALMTVYNGQRYLASAVQSILNQDLRDIEFIIVDDGSTDDSPDILRRLAQTDSRLRVVSRPNTGIPRAANEGLALCRAPYIARMDSDDIALPHRFRRQLQYMNDAAAICVGSYVQLIDAKGRYLTTQKPPVDDATIQKLALAGHGSIFHPAAMITRQALQTIGGYDNDFDCSLDLDLWLRLGEVGPLGNVPDALLQYRLHNQGISEQKRHRQRERARLACDRACQRRGITAAFEADEPWRPGQDRHSRQHYALKYGWWAFNSAQRKTAMIYAAKAIAATPWRSAGYKLLACAAAKPMPAQHDDPAPPQSASSTTASDPSPAPGADCSAASAKTDAR